MRAFTVVLMENELDHLIKIVEEKRDSQDFLNMVIVELIAVLQHYKRKGA